jgi:hypothetical protein
MLKEWAWARFRASRYNCHFAFLDLNNLKVCWTRGKLGGRYATDLRCGANFHCSKFYRVSTCYL